jgi:putative endonuclease
MERFYYVYLLASRPYGTLYVGVTNDLIRRVWEHRNGAVEGFTREHAVHDLVWHEAHAEIVQAITREKQIKKWRRAWKVNLIQAKNPRWEDLYPSLLG